MLDRFVYGAATRLSPESPVPVLAIRDENLMLGGVGNVLANLHGLGVPGLCADRRRRRRRGGGCPAGWRLALGVDAGGVLAEAGRPTTVKTRFPRRAPAIAARRLRKHRFHHGCDGGVAARAGNAVCCPRKSARLILSDYGKGVLTPSLLAALIDAARQCRRACAGRSEGRRLCDLPRRVGRHAEPRRTGRSDRPADPCR